MTGKKKRILILTDLDGTLLDPQNYSFEEALPALQKVKKEKIPLILCSSKTRAEMELYQRKMELKEPFISENGGAVFIPQGYFRQMPVEAKRKGRYLVLELGTPYRKIRKKFSEVFGELDLKAVGFGEMKPAEISSLLNLNQVEANLAKKREYDEPFYLQGKEDKEKINLAKRKFNQSGLTLTTGGRLFHLTGNNDKGKAARWLIQTYKTNWGDELIIIGLGDSLNDLSLLESVDIPVLVRKEDGSYQQEIINRLKVYKAPDMGPRGWNQAVLDLIEKHESKGE
jgi:mannosyl-3-phosphoglycerate phosphatase